MKIKEKLIAWLTKDVDLIYTSIGNLPVKDLEYHHEWVFNEDGIYFHEMYTLNGKMVKEGAHIYKMPIGTTLNIQQGNL